jgi:hypothetical protein
MLMDDPHARDEMVRRLVRLEELLADRARADGEVAQRRPPSAQAAACTIDPRVDRPLLPRRLLRVVPRDP